MSNYGVIPPWINSGIYCDDISITFKYQGDTVPTVYLFLGMFLPPFLVVRKKNYNLYNKKSQCCVRSSP